MYVRRANLRLLVSTKCHNIDQARAVKLILGSITALHDMVMPSQLSRLHKEMLF